MPFLGRPMKQVIKYYCKCGNEAIVHHKVTGEWLCVFCYVKYICNRKGIDNVYMGYGEDGSQDFFVELVDLLPIKVYWN